MTLKPRCFATDKRRENQWTCSKAFTWVVMRLLHAGCRMLLGWISMKILAEHSPRTQQKAPLVLPKGNISFRGDITPAFLLDLLRKSLYLGQWLKKISRAQQFWMPFERLQFQHWRQATSFRTNRRLFNCDYTFVMGKVSGQKVSWLALWAIAMLTSTSLTSSCTVYWGRTGKNCTNISVMFPV